MNRTVDVLDLSEDARELVRECEVQGTRTLFERQGRTIAILVSYDEYLALRETVEIANDALLFARLSTAYDEPAVPLTSLDDTRPGPAEAERLHVAQTAADDWSAFSSADRDQLWPSLIEINDDPIAGAPLFDPLKGLWSHRTGAFRTIYRIAAEARQIVVLSISRVRNAERAQNNI